MGSSTPGSRSCRNRSPRTRSHEKSARCSTSRSRRGILRTGLECGLNGVEGPSNWAFLWYDVPESGSTRVRSLRDDDVRRFGHIEPDRMVLSQVSGADRQDECVACRPAHESQHHRVLRLGGCVFLEQRRRGTNSTWAILQRLAVCADPDNLQSARRSLRERRLSARREGLQESEASSGCAPAYFVSDALLRAVLSSAVRVREPSRAHGPPDVLPHRLDDCCAVPAGLRSAAPVRWKTEGVASRVGSVTAGSFRIVQREEQPGVRSFWQTGGPVDPHREFNDHQRP
jgi:hypothetical protein